MIRQAHTLKGLAGNLGAIELQASAKQLEMSCRENPQSIDEPLDRLLANLGDVIDGLAVIETASSSENGGEQVDPDIIQQKMKALRKLVSNDAVDSITFLDEIERLIVGSTMEVQFTQLHKLIGGYEFDAALTEIDRLSDELGIDLS